MDNQDILLQVLHTLDNSTLKNLSLTPLWQNARVIVKEQHFWYLRVQYLLNCKLQLRASSHQGCWKRAYYLLEAYLEDNSLEVFNDLLTTQILLETGYNPTCNQNCALLHACYNGNEEVVSLLLADGRADPTANHGYCISHVVQHPSKSGVLRLLLEDGRADPTYTVVRRKTSLVIACQASNLEAVKLLLTDKRVDPSEVEGYALPSILVEDMNNTRIEILRLLLADSRVDPSVALGDAIAFNLEEVMRLLLADARTNLDHDHHYYLTGLVHNDRDLILKMLLADVRFDNAIRNVQLLVSAAEWGSVKITKLLLADPRVVPSYDALYQAVRHGKTRVVKLLLEDGRIDPSKDDNCVLKLALLRGESSIIAVLLREDKRVAALL